MAKWQVLFVVGLAYIVTVLSTALVVLLLSPIAEQYGVSLAAVGWVVIVEGLVIVALLLPVGGLADSFGRRRVLVGGLGLFALGTFFAGVAPTFPLLIGARLVMSLGNTMIQAVATGLLVAAFPAGERGIAMGGQTTAVSVGGASGPLLGGFLLRFLEWNTLFLLLVVPILATMIAAMVLLPDDRHEMTQTRFGDYPGGLFSASAVVLLVVMISNPFGLALGSPLMVAGWCLCAALAAVFIWWERRHVEPMLQLQLFSDHTFRTAVLVRTIGFVASAAFTILLPIYLLSVRDVTSTMAGLVLALRAVGQGVAAQIAGRVYDSLGPRAPTILGFALQAAATIVLASASTGTAVWLVAVTATLFGFGQSLWNVPNNSAMMGATSARTLGVVGAFTNVARTLGSVTGQAIAAALVAGVMVRRGFDIPLAEVNTIPGAIGAFLDGWNIAFVVATVLIAVGCVIGLWLPHGRPEG